MRIFGLLLDFCCRIRRVKVNYSETLWFVAHFLFSWKKGECNKSARRRFFARLLLLWWEERCI